MSMDAFDPTGKLALLWGRRSVRRFRPDAVSDDLVRALLAAAMAAPSACGADPWRFVVVRERATLSRLAEGLPYGKMLEHAPLGIAVCGELGAAHDAQLGYLLQDCSAAIENLLLAAHGLGLGACWLGVHPREPRAAHLATVLSLPGTVVPVACVAIGYAEQTPPPRTRYDERYVHLERW